jgi:hypothetical protein
MQHQTQRQQPVAPPAFTQADVRRFAAELVDVMDTLLKIIERETELVRAGKVTEAIALDAKKTELSRHYVNIVSALKTNRDYLKATAPELLTTLHRHHDVFRAMLQINLTVLATAHAVSEGIVRGVNAEMQRRNIPQTYTANGQRAMPGPRHITPLAVSRSL